MSLTRVPGLTLTGGCLENPWALRVENTFFVVGPKRSLSLGSIFTERRVRSCPSSCDRRVPSCDRRAPSCERRLPSCDNRRGISVGCRADRRASSKRSRSVGSCSSGSPASATESGSLLADVVARFKGDGRAFGGSRSSSGSSKRPESCVRGAEAAADDLKSTSPVPTTLTSRSRVQGQEVGIALSARRPEARVGIDRRVPSKASLSSSPNELPAKARVSASAAKHSVKQGLAETRKKEGLVHLEYPAASHGTSSSSSSRATRKSNQLLDEPKSDAVHEARLNSLAAAKHSSRKVQSLAPKVVKQVQKMTAAERSHPSQLGPSQRPQIQRAHGKSSVALFPQSDGHPMEDSRKMPQPSPFVLARLKLVRIALLIAGVIACFALSFSLLKQEDMDAKFSENSSCPSGSERSCLVGNGVHEADSTAPFDEFQHTMSNIKALFGRFEQLRPLLGADTLLNEGENLRFRFSEILEKVRVASINGESVLRAAEHAHIFVFRADLIAYLERAEAHVVLPGTASVPTDALRGVLSTHFGMEKSVPGPSSPIGDDDNMALDRSMEAAFLRTADAQKRYELLQSKVRRLPSQMNQEIAARWRQHQKTLSLLQQRRRWRQHIESQGVREALEVRLSTGRQYVMDLEAFVSSQEAFIKEVEAVVQGHSGAPGHGSVR